MSRPNTPESTPQPSITLQRIYDDEESAGTRVLVDRLWPRGISKEQADLDLWLREVAPSNELRKWYDHDPEKTEEFHNRYSTELQDADRAAAFAELKKLAQLEPVTLLTASKAVAISHAAFLRDLLNSSES